MATQIGSSVERAGVSAAQPFGPPVAPSQYRRLAPNAARKKVLQLISEQNAMPVDQLARFFDLHRSDMETVISQFHAAGWVNARRYITGDDIWVSLRHKGNVLAGTGFHNHPVHYRSFAHWHAINEARFLVEKSPAECTWVCERMLRREQGGRPQGHLPDAMILIDNQRHAIEVELSHKNPDHLREKITANESQYDRVVYFAVPAVCRRFDRLKLQESHPRLVVQEIPEVERGLNRPDWRVPGDPPPSSRGGRDVLSMSDDDLDTLDLIADQGHIPMDQLERFLGKDQSETERLVSRFVDDGLVRRARPLVDEPNWVWLTQAGNSISRRDLNYIVPKVGGLEMVRAVNEVRLFVTKNSPDVDWISRRVLRHEHGMEGSLPYGVLRVGSELHSIDIVLFPSDPHQLLRKLELRRRQFDMAVWFYSGRARSPLENFARFEESSTFRVWPLPDAQYLHMAPRQKAGKRGERRKARKRGDGSSARDLWARLAARPPVALSPIVTDAVPVDAVRAIARKRGDTQLPGVIAAWRKPGGGFAVYCLETDAGNYRVVHAPVGWRADETTTEVWCEKESGPLTDPRLKQVVRKGPKPFVEPQRFELDDELWAEIRPMIPPIEERKSTRTRQLISDRAVLSGILWRLRNRVGFTELPQALGYGSGSTTHLRLREWEDLGIWTAVEEMLKARLPEGKNLNWSSLAPRGSQAAERDAGFNGRQYTCLAEAGRDPSRKFSISDYASAYGICYDTAHTDLVKLAELSLLIGTREEGPEFVFVAAGDLSARLRRLAEEGKLVQ